MRDWFTDYLEACNRHDLDALRSLIAPSVRRAHRPAGVDAWISDLVELYAAFPDWRVRRIQLVVEEDRLAAHLRSSGTHTGTFRGVAATGRHANVAEFGFYRLSDGAISEFTGSSDGELIAQISATP